MLVRGVVVSALLSAICTPSTAAQAPTIRDSAGIRIVESPPVASIPVRFTLAGKPDVVVGGLRDNPADELRPYVSYPFGLMLSGNRILVGDGDHWGVFDATGKLVSRIGRAGAGPGEFRTTQNGCRFRGDSLVLWDVGNRRISVWGPDGKLAREYVPSGFAMGTSCLNDGSIMVQGAHVESPRQDVPMVNYSIVTSKGTARATTPALPTTLYSGSVMREVRIVGRGDHFFHADAVEFGVRVLDHNGKVIQIVRTRDVADPVTAANLAARSMACLGNPVTKVCTPQPTKAKTWPAYYRFAVGDDGRIWFRLNGGGGDSTWVGFDSTGRTVGRLVVPLGKAGARREIVHFGRDNALVSDFDDDGARRLSVFRIVPASGQ